VLSALQFPKVKQLETTYAEMERIGMSVCDRRRGELAAMDEPVVESLLDVLLTTVDEDGEPLTDDDLWGDLNDIIAAGHRTSAATLTVAMYYLARNPEIKRQAEAEVAQLGGRVPTFDDLKEGQLEYVERVVKEALRLHPPISLFPRVAAADDVLPSGHEVKQGDTIMMSTYAMGRNPRIWDSPDEFDPERFTEERLSELQVQPQEGQSLEEAERRAQQRIKAGRDFTYTPFGAGPRSCIGGKFAQMSISLQLASMLQRFDMSNVSPSSGPIPFRYDVTMVFEAPIMMEACPRETVLGA